MMRVEKKIFVATGIATGILFIILLVGYGGITGGYKRNLQFSFNTTTNAYTNDFEGHKTKINSAATGLSKWDDEVSIELGNPDGFAPLSGIIAGTGGRELGAASDLMDLKWYFKNVSENDEGLEYEIILKRKPSINSISMPIKTQNLVYYYQPPLYEDYGLSAPNATCNATDCEGSHRPENVVGSYAVYHSSKMNNEYKTGKAFHIYRPLVNDAKNDTIWADMNITNGTMTITVNQTWLNSAAYPVTIDPTIGYTSVPATGYTTLEDNIAGSNAGMPDNNSVGVSMTAYVEVITASKNMKTALYYMNSSLVPNSVTSEITVPISTGWVTLNFSTQPDLSNQSYILVAHGSNASGNFFMFYDNVAGYSRYMQAHVYVSGFPNPATFDVAGNPRYGIYVNYTSSADNPPTMLIDSPTNTSYTNANVTLNFRAGDDNGVSQCWYSLDNGANTSISGCANTTLDTGVNGSFILRIYANDTINQSANANVNFSVSAAADSCTYSSGDWNVNCPDNCTITTNYNLAGNTLNFTGSGQFNANANISHIGRLVLSDGCKIVIGSGEVLG